MKTTKAIFFSLCVLFAAAATAQDTAHTRPERPDPTERAARQTERLTKALDLTPEQAERVKAVNLAFAEQMESARADRDAERNAHREEMRAANAQRQEAMEAILNPEQRAKLEALHAERKDRRKGGHRRRDRG